MKVGLTTAAWLLESILLWPLVAVFVPGLPGLAVSFAIGLLLFAIWLTASRRMGQR